MIISFSCWFLVYVLLTTCPFYDLDTPCDIDCDFVMWHNVHWVNRPVSYPSVWPIWCSRCLMYVWLFNLIYRLCNTWYSYACTYCRQWCTCQCIQSLLCIWIVCLYVLMWGISSKYCKHTYAWPYVYMYMINTQSHFFIIFVIYMLLILTYTSIWFCFVCEVYFMYVCHVVCYVHFYYM